MRIYRTHHGQVDRNRTPDVPMRRRDDHRRRRPGRRSGGRMSAAVSLPTSLPTSLPREAPAGVLSPSQVTTFLDCQPRWYYGSVLKLPAPPPSSLALGTAVHHVARLCLL